VLLYVEIRNHLYCNCIAADEFMKSRATGPPRGLKHDRAQAPRDRETNTNAG